MTTTTPQDSEFQIKLITSSYRLFDMHLRYTDFILSYVSRFFQLADTYEQLSIILKKIQNVILGYT